jgi:hypothetical protein
VQSHAFSKPETEHVEPATSQVLEGSSPSGQSVHVQLAPLQVHRTSSCWQLSPRWLAEQYSPPVHVGSPPQADTIIASSTRRMGAH